MSGSCVEPGVPGRRKGDDRWGLFANDFFMADRFFNRASARRFRMEVIIAVSALFALMVAAGMLNKKLSEIPWSRK